NDGRFWPAAPTLENYRVVFHTDLFTSALRNSIGISLVATALSVTLATLAAYAIARLEFPGKKAILSVALAIAMFPTVALVGPLAAPGVFTAAILTFFFAWNDFVFGISLTSTGRARTVPAALAFFTGASQFQQPAAAIAAAAVIVTIPVIVLVLVFQRRIVARLTAGAVKG